MFGNFVISALQNEINFHFCLSGRAAGQRPLPNGESRRDERSRACPSGDGCVPDIEQQRMGGRERVLRGAGVSPTPSSTDGRARARPSGGGCVPDAEQQRMGGRERALRGMSVSPTPSSSGWAGASASFGGRVFPTLSTTIGLPDPNQSSEKK